MYDILGILKIKTPDIREFLLVVKNKPIQVHACNGLYCPMRHDVCCTIVLKSGQLTAVRFENFVIVMMKAVSDFLMLFF